MVGICNRVSLESGSVRLHLISRAPSGARLTIFFTEAWGIVLPDPGRFLTIFIMNWRKIGLGLFVVLVTAVFVTDVICLSNMRNIGGSAQTGYSANGRYFVSSHGHQHEVSREDYELAWNSEEISRIATMSLFAVGIVVFLLPSGARKTDAIADSKT